MNRSFSRQRGQALAELALVLPLLVLLMVGTVDLGRLFYAFQSVENAAATGALYGSQSYYNAGQSTTIRSNALAAASDITNLFPVVTSTVSSANVAVTCSATYHTYLPWKSIVSWFITNYSTGNAYDIPLQRTVNMRILQ